MTLKELIEQKKSIENEIEENDGELTPELEKYFDDAETALEEKFENTVYAIKHFEDAVSYYKERAEEATSYRKKAENKIASIKSFLYDTIKHKLEMSEYSTPMCRIVPTLSVRKSVDIDKVGPKEKKYVAELTYEQLIALGISESECNVKCLVSSLPEGHEAIVSNITPTIKLLKAKL